MTFHPRFFRIPPKRTGAICPCQSAGYLQSTIELNKKVYLQAWRPGKAGPPGERDGDARGLPALVEEIRPVRRSIPRQPPPHHDECNTVLRRAKPDGVSVIWRPARRGR